MMCGPQPQNLLPFDCLLLLAVISFLEGQDFASLASATEPSTEQVSIEDGQVDADEQAHFESLQNLITKYCLH